MAIPYRKAERIRETVSTTGTGLVVNLDGATLQCRSFVNGLMVPYGEGTAGDQVRAPYVLLSGDGISWEKGTCTVTAGTPDTLSRDTIEFSTNSNARINLVGISKAYVFEPAMFAVGFDQEFGSSVGNLLFRSATGWVALAPGYITKLHLATVATTGPLPACTYAHGSGAADIGATLTMTANGDVTVDGEAIAAFGGGGVAPLGYRILVKNQIVAAQNGIYVVTQIGDGSHPLILTRASDAADTFYFGGGDLVFIGSGVANKASIWTGIPGAIPFTLGTTDLIFAQVVGNTATGVSAQIDSAFGNAEGNILQRGPTGWQVLAPGTVGQVLTSGGAAALNSWAAIPTDTDVDTGITQLTGDVTAGPGSGSQAAAIASHAVTNAKAAQMAAHTFKGNNTGSTADAADLTATQLTAELNVVVGDAGAGGTKGLVPAPAAGDAAAGKFLKADGTYATPSGGGGGGASAPTVRGTGIQASSAASYAVAWPTGTVAGDLALIFFGGAYQLNSIPTGWTALDQQTGSNTNGTTIAKVLTAGDITTGSVVLTPGGTYDSCVAIITFVGATSMLALGAVQRNGAGATSVSLFNSAYGQAPFGVFFSMNRASSTNTCSQGTNQRQANTTNASGCLYAGVPTGAPFQAGVTWSFSSAGTGYYCISCFVLGP